MIQRFIEFIEAYLKAQIVKNYKIDIYIMNAWSEKRLLQFHPEKCKTMRIGKSKVNEYKYRLKK